MGYIIEGTGGLIPLEPLQDVISKYLSNCKIGDVPVKVKDTEISLIEKTNELSCFILQQYIYGGNLDSVLVYQLHNGYHPLDPPVEEELKNKGMFPSHVVKMAVEAAAPWYSGLFFDNPNKEKIERTESLAKKIKEGVPLVERLFCCFWELNQGKLIYTLKEI